MLLLAPVVPENRTQQMQTLSSCRSLGSANTRFRVLQSTDGRALVCQRDRHKISVSKTKVSIQGKKTPI
ncbi:hypothetical protein, partial [Klebsiella pneumoniae]|uniref:hypothetical protein n=1 Tax=Klebsiella pneumoniae TaxID=573 RepID=UPI0024DEC9BE